MEKKDLSLEKSIFDLQKKIQAINFDDKKEIKQNFQKLIEENVKQLKAENDISSKQKDEKINCLEEEMNKVHNQSNDLIKLQTNFNDLQSKFIQEKEKRINLENELKKIQQINIDNENKIEQLKQYFQKLIDENIKQLKDENDVCLKKKMKKLILWKLKLKKQMI
uniref:Uncharacterized protein n=1 Tax=Meloidogyne enterolobii TaxID=390850 RepID=A0A6V7XRG4_MELEN|nr:unnamed protein product [Meloidogyne enterolobii]